MKEMKQSYKYNYISSRYKKSIDDFNRFYNEANPQNIFWIQQNHRRIMIFHSNNDTQLGFYTDSEKQVLSHWKLIDQVDLKIKFPQKEFFSNVKQLFEYLSRNRHVISIVKCGLGSFKIINQRQQTLQLFIVLKFSDLKVQNKERVKQRRGLQQFLSNKYERLQIQNERQKLQQQLQNEQREIMRNNTLILLNTLKNPYEEKMPKQFSNGVELLILSDEQIPFQSAFTFYKHHPILIRLWQPFFGGKTRLFKNNSCIPAKSKVTYNIIRTSKDIQNKNFRQLVGVGSQTATDPYSQIHLDESLFYELNSGTLHEGAVEKQIGITIAKSQLLRVSVDNFHHLVTWYKGEKVIAQGKIMNNLKDKQLSLMIKVCFGFGNEKILMKKASEIAQYKVYMQQYIVLQIIIYFILLS